MSIYHVIGLMSGTSLDGLDIAYCTFEKKEKWEYKIVHAETIDYSEEFRVKLGTLYAASATDLIAFDHILGRRFGKEVNAFIKKNHIKPDFISSHGHTIFHRPEKGFTLQIGNGADIYAETGIPVICDFRSVDVAFGGQGAPLVPIGDQLLFQQFELCLNLGGIANISFDNENNKRVAYDICPVNFILNYLANEAGQAYDNGGSLSRQGNINQELLVQLENLEFYKKHYPKSLGREWIEQEVIPLMNRYENIKDKLATFCNHIASRINHDIEQYVLSKTKNQRVPVVFTTGGGAFNKFLIEQLQRVGKNKVQYFVPDKHIVSFKEALIFAFLGVLRKRGEINCLSAVTGASRDNCGGIIYGM